MHYLVTNDGKKHRLFKKEDPHSEHVVEVAWDFNLAKQSLINIGSHHLWTQIFPGVTVPQEIIDAENAMFPFEVPDE